MTITTPSPEASEPIARSEREILTKAAQIRKTRAVARAQRRQALASQLRAEPVPMPAGPFRVICIDPPWRYDKGTHNSNVRGLVDYPDMSLEEICSLPIPKLAHPDAVLWLWITNTFLAEGAGTQCLRAWGFTPKTILTWDKVLMGTGSWIRNVTEQCIFAVRGKPLVTLSNQTTLLREQRREHSRKPEAFYELVEALCPGSKVELFARQRRPGWAAWGAGLANEVAS